MKINILKSLGPFQIVANQWMMNFVNSVMEAVAIVDGIPFAYAVNINVSV